MNPKADWYFDKNEQWQKEIRQMRAIALGCGLEETLKWGCPCYQYNNANIVLIHVFKEYCAFLLFKGVLLQDPNGILMQQTKNVQSARQIRFTDVKELIQQKNILKAYMYEAIEVEKAGLKVKLKKTSGYSIPEEFQTRLNKNSALKKAFEALTPGRQRAYLFYFGQAKQSKTREARVEKYIPKILDGLGLED
ncbi:YdeI/OmpD-associated family protein [Agriterribacter sp.]|uniref:YdeI/OmpD-associated family protein n=1 Tax=Agriterribacter sp. TaxID=2821509 RepID=UPI002C667171|nr:YdeI/OmpD-associated family protein [Agriterribacter sp.]HTN06324.1 YdeI/OmpD-associated family protein [Agriterribacter sp.]